MRENISNTVLGVLGYFIAKILHIVPITNWNSECKSLETSRSLPRHCLLHSNMLFGVVSSYRHIANIIFRKRVVLSSKAGGSNSKHTSWKQARGRDHRARWLSFGALSGEYIQGSKAGMRGPSRRLVGQVPTETALWEGVVTLGNIAIQEVTKGWREEALGFSSDGLFLPFSVRSWKKRGAGITLDNSSLSHFFLL